MTKHAIGASIACAALLAAAAALAAPAASAAGGASRGDLAPGCVSENEFDQLRDGMTRTRVHNLIGTSGLPNAGGPGMEQRIYDKCGPSDAWATLTFRQRADGPWRLRDKSLEPG